MTNEIAIIADVHGNRWALDVVLDDIRLRGIERIANLGDHLHGPLDPAGTAKRLMDSNIVHISGNQDRVLVAVSEGKPALPDDLFVLSHLKSAHVEWLKNLPKTCVVDGIFCCHGTPQSDEDYLLESVTPTGAFLTKGAEVTRKLSGIEQQVIVCGHSHVARTVWLPDGRLVVNPGSVGYPAYDHDVPYPHVMEAGSPHARYAILKPSIAGWSVEHIALPYPWNEAADVAKFYGRTDWVEWLLTGRARLA
jgi:predicted phosphodiesterase